MFGILWPRPYLYILRNNTPKNIGNSRGRPWCRIWKTRSGVRQIWLCALYQILRGIRNDRFIYRLYRVGWRLWLLSIAKKIRWHCMKQYHSIIFFLMPHILIYASGIPYFKKLTRLEYALTLNCRTTGRLHFGFCAMMLYLIFVVTNGIYFICPKNIMKIK